jgi:hypothetical protein
MSKGHGAEGFECGMWNGECGIGNSEWGMKKGEAEKLKAENVGGWRIAVGG